MECDVNKRVQTSARQQDIYLPCGHTYPFEELAKWPAENAESCTLMLGYRAPYSYKQLIDFLHMRSIAGVESVNDHGQYCRVVRIQKKIGWIFVCHAPENQAIKLTVSRSLFDVLPEVVNKVKLLFDSDCNPAAVEQGLSDFYDKVAPRYRIPGIRVPCSFDGFELCVRAILGQQITVKAANTLAGRVAETFGQPYFFDSAPLTLPSFELNYVFPAPEAFCEPDAAKRLGELGIIRRRAEAICTIAHKIIDGSLVLDPSADVELTMKELVSIKGIGPWTAHYVAMRALGWSDAFPKEDYGVKMAFPTMKPREIEALSQAWRPYRSYAVLSLWSAPPE